MHACIMFDVHMRMCVLCMQTCVRTYICPHTSMCPHTIPVREHALTNRHMEQGRPADQCVEAAVALYFAHVAAGKKTVVRIFYRVTLRWTFHIKVIPNCSRVPPVASSFRTTPWEVRPGS